MNSKEENKLSMYITVQKVTNYHSEVWQNLPAFVTIFNKFEEKINDIRETRLIQEGKITGVTKDKAEAQKKATEKGLQVATAVFAFASVAGNNKLKYRVSYSPTVLLRSRDTILADRLNVINESARQNITKLQNYGVLKSDIDELTTLINTYISMLEDPRQAITNRSRATKELKEHFKQADKILKEQSDKLMLQFKDDHSAFHQQYFNARLIINQGIRHKKTEEEKVDKPGN